MLKDNICAVTIQVDSFFTDINMWQPFVWDVLISQVSHEERRVWGFKMFRKFDLINKDKELITTVLTKDKKNGENCKNDH